MLHHSWAYKLLNFGTFAYPLTIIWRLNQLYVNCTISTQFAPKSVYLRSKIEKIFWGRGTAPSPDPSPGGEGDTPSPHLTPLDAFGASILSRLRRSNLAFPQFFFRKRPLETGPQALPTLLLLLLLWFLLLSDVQNTRLYGFFISKPIVINLCLNYRLKTAFSTIAHEFRIFKLSPNELIIINF